MNNNIIINVGRQLGCGGFEIAQRLAAEFNARLLDKELLDLAAKESGFSQKIFKSSDEHRGFFHHFFPSRYTMQPNGTFYDNKISPESLFQFQSDAIRKAAEEGPCVIVGRCADYILRDFPNSVDIFVTANEEDRVARVSRSKMCDVNTARKLIEKKEEERSEYYNYYTGKTWGEAKSYDICINSSILGIEKTAEFLAEYIRKATASPAAEVCPPDNV